MNVPFIEETNILRYYFDMKESNGSFEYLTKTQFSCLYHLARGKNIKMIAQLKGISPRTVENHLSQAKEKLNFSSNLQLINLFEKSIYSLINRPLG